MRKVLLFLYLLLFLFFFPKKTRAVENFLVTNDMSYIVSENGSTNVSFHVSLTNTTSQFYASLYKINLGFHDISNITGSDAQGPIIPKLTKNENGYVLEIPLNKHVVGIGNTLPFTISFDTKDIVSNIGKSREIYIPGVKNNQFNDFNIMVKLPKSFGTPSYLRPAGSLYDLSENALSFNKQQIGTSGISIGFSENQSYNFKLTYHLKNNNIFPAKTEIAIPPTTNYQDVVIEEINPKPFQVRIDDDGNWMAQYSLYPIEKKDVVVKGKINTHLYPSKESLYQNTPDPYLKELPYWQTSDNQIVKKAKDLKTPQAIYDFVTKSLTYDFSRVTNNKPRLGAAEVLKNPTSSVCLEFTDLFIALSRAAGIPAREVAGFAYTRNSISHPSGLVKDILHAWPEYYDTNTQAWIMVDPTWGNTTGGTDYFSILDTDHIVFTIRGASSIYPVPAGGYKQRQNDFEKDVEITPDDNEISHAEQLEFENVIPAKVFSGLPLNASLLMKNKGNGLSSNYTITVTSRVLNPHTQTITFDKIPPFGVSQKTLTIDRPSFLTNTNDIITIQVGEKSYTSPVYISPFAFTARQLLIGGIIGAGISGFIIWIRSLKSRDISFFR